MKSIKMNKKLFLLIVSLCFFVCCTNTKEDYLDLDPFIFVSVTNKHDTCTIGTFTSDLYYELNIKCMSELDFYEYIEDAIEKKQALVVSDDYFLVCQKESLHGTWLSVLVLKTLEADVLVQIPPMNAIKAESILASLFCRCSSQLWIPKK